ncbi:MAG: MFS transporter [Saprospiraceae bacterium]|nr:MFS transporter [Saprospiraceae bacterium]
MHPKPVRLLSLAVVVSALGFFVDVYDLLLFAIIRKASLADLGLSPAQILTEGETLLSVQMIGMLLGGILFGIIGDKKGRLSVLFGSILLYSVANILNGLVSSIPQYLVLRLIAGIGLAGELGAGLTLVSEQLPKGKRSLAAGLIAGFGVLGAVAAFLISNVFDWRSCYYIGGALGLLLLLLRVSVHESGLFKQVRQRDVQRGNFLMFFNRRERFGRYLKCILIGLPVWYVIGVLIAFSDQFGQAFGIAGIEPGKAIMCLYIFVGLGDLAVGWLSERLRSRKKTLFIFYGITLVFMGLFFRQQGGSAEVFYLLCMGLGFGIGFNVVYLTLGVEQFGTNLRASAAISIPNMVRGALPLIMLLFKSTRNWFQDYVTGAWVTGLILFAIAIGAGLSIRESHGTDLVFVEQ